MNKLIINFKRLVLGYSKVERDFYKFNIRYWKKQYASKDDYILLDGVQHHPEHLIQAARIAKAIEEVKNTKIICLLHTNFFRLNIYRYLYKSYFINHFISIFPKIIQPITLIKAYLGSKRFSIEFKNNNRIETLLGTAIFDLYIGDLLIDSLYKNKIIQRDKVIDKKAFNKVIRDMFYLYYYYNSIFQKYNVKYVVLSHRVYLFYGLLSRIAHIKGAEVYLYNQRRVRKYLPGDNIKVYEGKPIKEHIEFIRNNIKDYADIVDSYLGRRFNGELIEIDVELNKKTRKYSLDEIIDKYNFDKNLPIVIIFLHVLADANHLNEEYLFNSHYDWLVETVKIIRQNRSCNWLLKAHPSEIYYDEVGLAKKIVNEVITSGDNIKFANDDFKNSSAIGVAKAIITVHGTAGLEFSCFGIPTILAGAAHYSGFGFTHEPKTIDNYSKILSDIQNIKALTQEQIDTAKAVYFAYEFLNNVPSDVYPDYFPNTVTNYKERKEGEIRFLKNISEKLKTKNPKEDLFFYALKKLVASKNARQIVNPLYWK